MTKRKKTKRAAPTRRKIALTEKQAVTLASLGAAEEQARKAHDAYTSAIFDAAEIERGRVEALARDRRGRFVLTVEVLSQ